MSTTDPYVLQTIRAARAADALAVKGGHVVGVPPGLGVPKVETGIPGFDHVALGGLPKGRATVILGPAGSAKTVFAGQFLAEGTRRGQAGVFVTFEEPADDLRRNFATLGWDVAAWEKEDKWRFVDASPLAETNGQVEPPYNFDTLVARIGHAVDRTAADRLVIDTINAVTGPRAERGVSRQQLRALISDLRRMGLTTVITAESAHETAVSLEELGIEEFVSDNVVLLRNSYEEDRRRRTVEVLKMRGAMHRKGSYPFTVLPGQGVVVIPLSVIQLTQRSSEQRLTSGNQALDELCYGGFFRDSIVLASGATGTGKTLMVTEFVAAGCERGERSLLFAYEESRDQIFRNAGGWGRDFEQMERDGLLRVVASYPEVASLEDHLVEIKNEMDDYEPMRIAIDSLSALERIGSGKGFREFIIGLTSFVKAQQVCGLFTATSPGLMGGESITESHISTLTDAIILLRYVEVAGEVHRGLCVLKMRGSPHDHAIHEFVIDGQGMHIGEKFDGINGILAGRLVHDSVILGRTSG